MTPQRYKQLFENLKEKLTKEENDLGWHFCDEFDGLLVGPNCSEWQYCTCWPRIMKIQCEKRFVESGGKLADVEPFPIPFEDLSFLDAEPDL